MSTRAGLARAILVNLRAGRPVQGGSTITQQLAKNMFLTPERTLWRKVGELVLALWLEMRLSKPDILELYLNRVYFGAGAYGVEAASRRFFNKSAQEMTLAEAAVLAGLLKAPSRYSPRQPEARSPVPRSVVARWWRSAPPPSSDAQMQRDLRRRALRRCRKSCAARPGWNTPSMRCWSGCRRCRRRAREIVVETSIDANLQREGAAIVHASSRRRPRGWRPSQAALVCSITRVDQRAGRRAPWAESQFNRA